MSEYQSDQEEEIYATLVEVNQEPIELYKVLKIGNLVSGGGEAKQVISEGYVFLNGEEETRKRKKVYAGDLVGFNGEYLQVAIKGQTDGYDIVDEIGADEISIDELSVNEPSVNASNAHELSAEQEKPAAQKSTPKKRKPISF